MDKYEDMILSGPFDSDSDFLPVISMDEDEDLKENESYPKVIPIVAIKNTTLFPGIVIPITVSRDKSIKAFKKAYEDNKWIAVLSQKDSSVENPTAHDLYQVGTIAKILKLLKMPDGSTTAILKGTKRFGLISMLTDEPFWQGEIEPLEYLKIQNELKFQALIKTIKEKAHQIVNLSPSIPSEASLILKNINSDSFLINFVSSNLGVGIKIKQEILEISDLEEKAEKVLILMGKELQLLELKDEIENKVRTDIEQQQKEYFLNQQLKTIQNELGNNPQDKELQKLLLKAESLQWPKKAKERFEQEIEKVKRINPQVPDYSVMLNYLDLLTDLPWGKHTKDNFNLNKVNKVLDKDHFGLEKIKKRILEHLAVLKLRGDMKAPIICLVGPPGVGKTSLGKSIAKAIGREFIRMALGAVNDESEIRGHRKTYIGAMPGRIIQSIKKAKSDNPVFILDEIDKVGKGFRGDPSSALLEVLDPEQNENFYDNYLELEYDLSKVMFIATANDLSTIQPALRDRMEIIRLSGYSLEEKIEIAKRHLVPKQLLIHGLEKQHVSLSNKTLAFLISRYTREAGVRSLERQIASVMRHVAHKVALEETYEKKITDKMLPEIMGPIIFESDKYLMPKTSGVAVGLAWTSVGGDILFIESILSQGKGKLTLTGNLGNVMKESATTALSYIKANYKKLGIDMETLEKSDIHVHVPEGAIPKDGPSAGITMLSALTSALTGNRVKSHLAMSGEITLRGKVLPVGGIKEKILAARRSGIKEIILCKENEKHVKEIEENLIKNMTFHYVDEMMQVVKLAIEQ